MYYSKAFYKTKNVNLSIDIRGNGVGIPDYWMLQNKWFFFSTSADMTQCLLNKRIATVYFLIVQVHVITSCYQRKFIYVKILSEHSALK